MGLLDDVIVNAASAVNAVSKKAGEVVDKSKLRISTAELKRKISDKFEILGRYVYDTHVTDSADPDIIKQYYAEISELISELKTLQEALNITNERIICPKCSCENSLDSLYCRKCGSSLDFSNSYTPKQSREANDSSTIKSEFTPESKENTDFDTKTDENIQ